MSCDEDEYANRCDGCGSEFDDSVQLYPKLLVSKEAQTAKKLAEKEGGEVLCLPCWLEATEALESRQLATLLLNMLQKVMQLEKMPRISLGDGTIEKSPIGMPFNPPQPAPWTSPSPINPIYRYTTDKFTADPNQRPGSTIMCGGTQTISVSGPDKLYVSGNLSTHFGGTEIH